MRNLKSSYLSSDKLNLPLMDAQGVIWVYQRPDGGGVGDLLLLPLVGDVCPKFWALLEEMSFLLAVRTRSSPSCFREV